MRLHWVRGGSTTILQPGQGPKLSVVSLGGVKISSYTLVQLCALQQGCTGHYGVVH